MLAKTNDTETVYGVALQRDGDGNLLNYNLGMTREEAFSYYDNFQAWAVLKVDVTVLSSVDGEIEPRKENQ